MGMSRLDRRSALRRFLLFSVTATLATCAALQAQERSPDVRTTLFADVEQRLQKAQEMRAHLLAPDSFERAMKLYRDASEDFDKGRGLKGIQRKLSQADLRLAKAIEAAKLGQLTLQGALSARNDALKANAPEYAREPFESAEKRFFKAGKALESGNMKKAKRFGAEAEQLYRSAELHAIKNSLLGTVRQLLADARENKVHELAPMTYARAQRLLSETEALLNSNRYAASDAQGKAEEAEYEARHAIYLARLIKALDEHPDEIEAFFLAREEGIRKLARELGFTARFEEGLDRPVDRARVAVASLKQERHQLAEEVRQKGQKIRALEVQLDEFRAKEAGLAAELAEKQRRIEAEQRRAEKMRQVEALFAPSEATVLRKGNRLIIRLTGLTFPSGKAIIQPEYFSLLTKVQRVIREFPEAGITVEGHTDALGDARYNEALSIARAEAIRAYLLANMELDTRRIVAVGYGETRPIASNESRDGRARNRRIDLVLSIPTLTSTGSY